MSMNSACLISPTVNVKNAGMLEMGSLILYHCEADYVDTGTS